MQSCGIRVGVAKSKTVSRRAGNQASPYDGAQNWGQSKTCPVLQRAKLLKKVAPRARFELATLRLTAECSTIELPGICKAEQ